ncbi:sporulation protein [Vibrio sp. SS-MA-C1-2]|uniref:sporulation protein n=1 Tax=Vibrio sp. SS-MA-C1-2 TaxID=2908646 RepID=UPI001F33429F|nr:sporulation protein [Vibrio sp. SS-MA-C1-2]UJF19353.1 sporulation protein [Vibrio sp. SS-MA-C1-2]
MSLFNKATASLSLGTTQVDATIEQSNIIPGSHVELKIHAQAGSEEQEVSHLVVSLCCQYIEQQEIEERVKKSYALTQWQLPYAFRLNENEQRTFDAILSLPPNTPITIGDAQVWLEISSKIEDNFDPKEKDQLTIRPDLLQDAIFDALESEGLRIRNVECEAVSGFALPFVQEFEFVPVAGPFHGLWREIEVVSYHDDQQLHFWFEVDRQLKGMRGMLSSLVDRNEAHYHLSISTKSSPQDAALQVVNFLHHEL